MRENGIGLSSPDREVVEEVAVPAAEPYRVFELLGQYRLAVVWAEQELAALQQRQRELHAQVEAARSAVAALEKEFADNVAGWAALDEAESLKRELLYRWDTWRTCYENQLQTHYQELMRRQHEQAEAWRLALEALSNSWSTRIGLAMTWPIRAARRLLSRLRRRT